MWIELHQMSDGSPISINLNLVCSVRKFDERAVLEFGPDLFAIYTKESYDEVVTLLSQARLLTMVTG